MITTTTAAAAAATTTTTTTTKTVIKFAHFTPPSHRRQEGCTSGALGKCTVVITITIQIGQCKCGVITGVDTSFDTSVKT